MSQRNNLIQKGSTFAIILLFIGMSVIPSVPSEQTSTRDIITVDDEGDGDYTSIKEAINNANLGDTIEVYSGIYYEHGIEINTENVTLKGVAYELGNGNDTGKPFINGEGKDIVIIFYAKNTTLDNFHIENKDGTHHDILFLRSTADGCIISNNDLNHTTLYLIAVDGSNTKIINNNISHSGMRGGIVFFETSSNNIISGNVIYDVETGILLWDSDNNTITGNKINRCSRFGIDLASSGSNNINGNHIENNNIGIQVTNFHNQVKHNNFVDNELHAQFIYGFPILKCLTNRWIGNYWGRPRLLPYPILGLLVLIPIVQFDWRPAQEPYDI